MPFPLIRTFSYHCREKYGHVVGKIPLHAGAICPNRVRGGCIFCRAESFTPRFLQIEDDIREQLRKGKRNLTRLKFRQFLGYFQQESCTALDPARLESLIQRVLDDPDCRGVILSTRPDLVPQPLLEKLAPLVARSGKDCLFELGLQSVHQKSLELLNRNHRFDDFRDAVGRILAFDCFEAGAHLLLGIPGESAADMLQSVRRICRLGIHSLKFHHLQVVKGTVLEKMYQSGTVQMSSVEEYLLLLEKLLLYIPRNITIHRLWATSRPDLLVAPKWNVLTGSLSGMLRQGLLQKGLRQGLLAAAENNGKHAAKSPQSR